MPEFVVKDVNPDVANFERIKLLHQDETASRLLWSDGPDSVCFFSA